MRELIGKVWANPAFHAAAARIQRAWLSREFGVSCDDQPSLADVAKVVRASAILACSAESMHREKAYRSATSAFELYGDDVLPLAQAARVVLARLGNFPAMRTRDAIQSAQSDLPASLLGEELIVSDGRTIRMQDHSVVLTEFQHTLWTRLQARRRLAVTAPTSAGKSFILQIFIGALFEGEASRTVVYIVPTRALIAQISTGLRRLVPGEGVAARRVEVATVPIDADAALPKRAVFVMTQERLQMMLNGHPGFSADVVIVDEAHSISDGARGVLLQWVVDEFLRRQPDVQLLFASPGISNLDVFGRIFGLGDVERLPSREPTVAQNFIFVKLEESRAENVSLHLLEADRSLTPIAALSLERRNVTRVERLVNLSTRFGHGAANIIYANGPGDAETIALAIAARLRERKATERRQELAHLAAETVHPAYALVNCVRKGVAFHYSNMPTQIRQAVETAVVDGDIDFLVCTSTLLQGVNLPAKNVFMCKPEKGDDIPLESVDFWNLAGRAGRLLKEFQGNIFLIDYDRWKRKPLDQPRAVSVIPAVERGVLGRRSDLLRVISRPEDHRYDDGDLEAVFVRLLDDFSSGAFPETIRRLTAEVGTPPTGLEEALALAAKRITLPRDVLRRSPNISPHKQQDIYDLLRECAQVSKKDALALIPKHPRDSAAYHSYAQTLRICHRVILGLGPESRLHRFLALVALWWMQGRPLPRIIQNQLNRNAPDPEDRNPDLHRRQIVRNTLELVEKRVRYQCLRLISCYSAILAEVLRELGYDDAARSMPSIPLFLEVGASDRTSISLMAVGLSRVSATKIAPHMPNRRMDVEAVRQWLRTAPITEFGLSMLLLQELQAIIDRLGADPALR